MADCCTESAEEFFCYNCGWLLTKYEVGLELDGHLTDYVDHKRYAVALTFCNDCRASMLKIQEGGLAEAKRKARLLQRHDLTQNSCLACSDPSVEEVKPVETDCHHETPEGTCWYLSMSKYRTCPYPGIQCQPKIKGLIKIQ